MEIKESKAIFVQIAERICDEILLGKYNSDERIPSVREYAALVEVNVNTVVRSYDYLQNADVLYNKRGLGYFVSPGAKEQILSSRRELFMNEELPEFIAKLKQLDIPMSKVEEFYNKC